MGNDVSTVLGYSNYRKAFFTSLSTILIGQLAFI